MDKKIGIIAGNRRFPIILAEAAKKQGYQVVAVAIKGDTHRSLNRLVDKIHWLALSDFEKMFEIFKVEGVSDVVMAGQISPYRLFSREVLNSPIIQEMLNSIKDKKADTIFGAIAAKLACAGFTLLDSTSLLKNYMPTKGVLTKREPSFAEWENIYFGLGLVREIAFLDIGQTIAVKEKAVVGVEALEGTDNLIRRAGRIARGGLTVIKVSKPKQDMRFDVPVVGLGTVSALVKAKARCLAIEADKTLFIDKEASVRLADKAGIAIVAV